MIADEILKLTRQGITEVLAAKQDQAEPFMGDERRLAPRWPFPGTIELRPADGDGREQWFGTVRNVSETGLGASGDHYFELGTVLEIAFHLPEASFYGKGTVRYCKQVRGEFMLGLEFLFDE